MTIRTRNRIIYGLLTALWLLTAAWQIVEHRRVRLAARMALASRAQDTAAALSVVIRSQGRFGLAPQSRIIMAIEELVYATELTSVALLNASNDVVAAAGAPVDADIASLMAHREHWQGDQATFMNLVALGPNADVEVAGHMVSVVLDQEEQDNNGEMPRASRPPAGAPLFWKTVLDIHQYERLMAFMNNAPLTKEQASQILLWLPEELLPVERRESGLRLLAGRPLDTATLGDLAALLHRGPGARGRGRGRPPDDAMRRPHWLSEAEYERLIEARGVHWFLVTMPTHGVQTEIARDMRLRLPAAGIALLACLALVWAWSAFSHAADLQLRLVRAESLAAHLKELNMAAAGLVHETRNPLNIIRGLAQVVTRKTSTPSSIRTISEKITEESDRITERLNKFLDYSRPLSPQLTPVPLRDMLENIVAILESDRCDKGVCFTIDAPSIAVEADEDMLRQTIFNLLLNAVQAAPRDSTIAMRVLSQPRDLVALEIQDEGPGVPPEYCDDIFRPYFTTSAQGAGLGLAVVRQCVQAHGWTVRSVPSINGACFRVEGMRTIAKGKDS